MYSLVQADGSVKRFRSHILAKEWIHKHYDEEDSSYTLFTDYVPRDVVYIESVLHIKECKGCGATIEVSLNEDEYALVVCPRCQGRSIIE